LENARYLLIDSAHKAKLERRLRIEHTARIHVKMAAITTRETQTHLRLARLMRQEAVMHKYCAQLDAQAVGRAPAGANAPTFRSFGRQHIQQMNTAIAEAWAHQQLATRSQARTVWHKSVACLLRFIPDYRE
jgi:hypothetical protein